MTLKLSTTSLPLSLQVLTFFISIFVFPVMSRTITCIPCWTGDDCVSKQCDECSQGEVCLNNSEYLFDECASTFAGPTCGNKITSTCDKARGAFCTNGGTCGSYIIDGQHYEGCHCDSDYFGAHCQYEAKIWVRGIPGEASVPMIDPKFYTKDIPYRSDTPIIYMFISAGLVCFFLAFCAVLIKYVATAEKLKELQVRVTQDLDSQHNKQNRPVVKKIIGLEEDNVLTKRDELTDGDEVTNRDGVTKEDEVTNKDDLTKEDESIKEMC